MKYMGSKSRIAKHIVPIIQNEIDNYDNCKGYLEPFVGGANVIDKIRCEFKFGIDANKFLIALLTYVRDGGELPESISKEEYGRVRDEYNQIVKGKTSTMEYWYIGCVGFLASYNGRFFDGGYAKSGYEKTARGERFRDYYRESRDNLLAQAEDLKYCIFVSADYRKIGPHDLVVYCDPPYAGTKQYHGDKFDHDEFWDVMRKWSKDNVVLISEESAPDDFEVVWEQEVSRSIKSTDKSKSVEKLYRLKVKEDSYVG